MDNAFTMAQLIKLLGKTNQATIHEAKEDDMKDWESFLDLFYSDFSGKIKKITFLSAATMKIESGANCK